MQKGQRMTGVLRYDPAARYDVRSRDVEYRHDGSRSWLTRVWEPQGPGPFPMLLDVHGGAWGDNDRTRDAPIVEPLAAGGLVVAGVDFHLSSEAPYPAAQADINYATRWLKAHAPDFNASAAVFGGLGISSGGHQIILNAMRPQDPRYAGIPLSEAPDVDARFDYLIVGWVPIDPWDRYVTSKEKGIQRLLDATVRYFGDEACMKEANPQLILERGEHVELPPVLLVQGSADEGISPFVAEKFVERYSRGGGVIELGKYPGEPHAFMRTPGPNTTRALEQMKSFIARQLAECGGSRPDETPPGRSAP